MPDLKTEGGLGPLRLADEELAIVSELTKRLTLNAGRVPETVEEFWRLIASALSFAVPPGTAVEMARSVLERLGEDWDDDFGENGRPSLSAYETLSDRIDARTRGDEDNADDDDDATGALAAEREILVVPQDVPVEVLIGWIKKKTLVLDPDWQRGYVWKNPRRRRFIESIFLKLPVPPVLLFQEQSSQKLFVIDGRQRLETLYRYHLGTSDKQRSFTTFGKTTPGWGDSSQLGVAAGRRFDKLPEEFQRRFLLYVVPARVFHNLERHKLYEVFKRYNTGGDKLNPAEIRNAVYQEVPLHEMLYRLAGEHGSDTKFKDDAERRAAALLKEIMRGKTARYGRYNFIGRVLAFANEKSGSVANAISQLMELRGKNEEDIERLRLQFVNALNVVCDWYPCPLAVEMPSGKTPFHEWIATIQMVSAVRALEWIEERRTEPDNIRAFIEKSWAEFAQGRPDGGNNLVGGVLQEKQNTTTHWERQRQWISAMEQACCPDKS